MQDMNKLLTQEPGPKLFFNRDGIELITHSNKNEPEAENWPILKTVTSLQKQNTALSSFVPQPPHVGSKRDGDNNISS